jgi:hypothetical protein
MRSYVRDIRKISAWINLIFSLYKITMVTPLKLA